jgi:hypothetical protein
MINIPLGTNITTKVPVDILFHNISSLGSYIMVKLIFRRTDFLFPTVTLWSSTSYHHSVNPEFNHVNPEFNHLPY